MRSLHLTLMVFCHVLLASAVLYLTTFTTNTDASPILVDQQPIVAQIIKQAPQQPQHQTVEQAVPISSLQQQSAIQSPVPREQSAIVHQAAPVAQNEPIQSVHKQMESSPLSAKSSPVATESKVVEVAEPKKAPEIVSTKSEVVKSVEQAPVQAISTKSDVKESVANEQRQQSPLPVVAVVDSKSPVVAKQENAAIVVKAPEAPIESKVQDVPPVVIQSQSAPIQHQSPAAVVESSDKPVVEAKKSEFPRVEQAINGKNVVADAEPIVKIIEQHLKVAPVAALPQAAALVAAKPEQSPVIEVVSGKSEAKVSVDQIRSIVIKDEPSPVASSEAKVAPKLDRKIEEAPEQVNQMKVPIEKPNQVIGVAQQQTAAVESPNEIVGKKIYNQDPNAPIAPLVKGGLGPLQLLATTLCSYQPDKQVADDCLNQLYSRRASLRKSLLEFMSLKFTNLEKLSSRLGSGLQVVPLKTVGDQPTPSHSSQLSPSHGWPVVGKCTAHDLKLMGEAAWCEGELGNAAANTGTSNNSAPVVGNQAAHQEEYGPKITSNQHATSRAQSARSIGSSLSFLPSPEQSSVISKLLHVGDIKDAPVVESAIYNLNLTQQQLASLEAQTTSTRECRRNALRYTKALFNHLAENQREASVTWPQLYALIDADDCARKRMIDIVTALSSFRTDTTSIRRDNLEFAFAMDDLRTKVLDNEVNVPLTFDKQFIEVEQFLQQSVRLMLSNIDPNRAKLTSMRYRSLMYGTANPDDQCIELHQRLLAQSYPTDCNPNQFGQLPDVLRMTASSLELWSIEKEISIRTGKTVDYPSSDLVGQQKVREDVKECIANLVSS